MRDTLLLFFGFLATLLLLLMAPIGKAHADTMDVIELTCALGVDHRDCSPHYGAVDVMKIGEASLPIECARWGMLSGPSAPTADMNAYYHKIMCVRR